MTTEPPPISIQNKSIDEILREDQPGYITRQNVELEASLDSEPWNPSEEIRNLVPNYDSIQVVLVGEETDLNELKKHFRDVKTIGLIILGHAVSRESLPLMICLSTDVTIYAFNPSDQLTARFLKYQLDTPEYYNLRFIVPVGLEESDFLYHKYGIDLTSCRSRVDSCSAKHTRLLEYMRNLPEPCLKNLYPFEAVKACKRKLMVERFDTVASIWLGIDKSELYHNATQLNHLHIKPLNLTATNVIKKRCILVRCLYDTLSNYVWREFDQMNAMTEHRLCDLEGHMKKLAMDLTEDEENPSSASCFYLHLDGYIWG